MTKSKLKTWLLMLPGAGTLLLLVLLPLSLLLLFSLITGNQISLSGSLSFRNYTNIFAGLFGPSCSNHYAWHFCNLQLNSDRLSGSLWFGKSSTAQMAKFSADNDHHSFLYITATINLFTDGDVTVSRSDHVVSRLVWS